VTRARPGRLLRLPSEGQLLVCTDLHGHLADFRRMVEIFRASQRAGERPFLLFTGDLIHGPNCPAEEWPSFLGEPYPDQSGQVVEGFLALRREAPGQVACLIGNHEHSHVGGPHTPKFWPDETAHFEEEVGPTRTRRYKKLFRELPVLAVSRCGLAITHAAPAVEIVGPEDIEELEYDGFEGLEIWSMAETRVLGALLWARYCPPAVARAFLDALGKGGPHLGVVVYGHEIIPEGYRKVGAEQLCLSTSFGVSVKHKVYLKVNLAGRYDSVADLRVGREIRSLY
jgi:hypothetical protein